VVQIKLRKSDRRVFNYQIKQRPLTVSYTFQSPGQTAAYNFLVGAGDHRVSSAPARIPTTSEQLLASLAVTAAQNNLAAAQANLAPENSFTTMGMSNLAPQINLGSNYPMGGAGPSPRATYGMGDGTSGTQGRFHLEGAASNPQARYPY
jgi:hypothetical protein